MRVDVPRSIVSEAFAKVAESPAFAESAALVRSGGSPVEMLQAMALRPEILLAFAATSEAIYPGGIVERRVKELVILEASRHNACQFCTQSHISIAASMGIGVASDGGGGLDPLALLDRPAEMTARERLAVEYTRAAQADSNRIPDALFAQLRTVYTDAEIVELTAMIGLISMLNMFNNCLRITYRGEYDA
jgi:AhpD family alkylhydroperoxidase